MKTLQQYLENSKNFVGEETEKTNQDNIDRILEFVLRENLESEFADLVARDDEWRKLAEKETVNYLIESKIHQTKFNRSESKIQLHRFVNGTIPAIKFII